MENDRHPPVYGDYDGNQFIGRIPVQKFNGQVLPASFCLDEGLLQDAVNGSIVGYSTTGQTLYIINGELIAKG